MVFPTELGVLATPKSAWHMQRLANGAAFVRDFELSAEITAKGNARADLIASIQNRLQNQGLAWDAPTQMNL